MCEVFRQWAYQQYYRWPLTLWVQLMTDKNRVLAQQHRREFFTSLNRENYFSTWRDDVIEFADWLNHDWHWLRNRYINGQFFNYVIKPNLHRPDYHLTPWNGDAFQEWADARFNDHRIKVSYVWKDYQEHWKVIRTLQKASESTHYYPEYDTYDVGDVPF